MNMNWSEAIKQLESAGWSQARIAEEIGLSISSVGDLKSARSTSPRGMAAVRLHALHSKVCGGSDQPANPASTQKAA